MDFDFSSEQIQLKDGVERLVASAYGSLNRRNVHAGGPLGFSDRVWTQIAEMGLTGIPFDEEDGGFGGGPVETLIVMEAFGNGLTLEPYLATVILGVGPSDLQAPEPSKRASSRASSRAGRDLRSP